MESARACTAEETSTSEVHAVRSSHARGRSSSPGSGLRHEPSSPPRTSRARSREEQRLPCGSRSPAATLLPSAPHFHGQCRLCAGDPTVVAPRAHRLSRRWRSQWATRPPRRNSQGLASAGAIVGSGLSGAGVVRRGDSTPDFGFGTRCRQCVGEDASDPSHVCIATGTSDDMGFSVRSGGGQRAPPRKVRDGVAHGAGSKRSVPTSTRSGRCTWIAASGRATPP